MKSREGVNMTQNNSHPRAEEINRIAELMIAEWERCEPQEGKVNPSRIANFADMARVVVEDYDGCPIHAGQIHGGEAAELRAGLEKMLSTCGGDIEGSEIYNLLDEVDARDSLAHAELRKEQRLKIEHLDSGAGQWVPCVGCHELNEGHPTGSWSGVFRCNLGNGCAECGGIGAVWDRFRDDERENGEVVDTQSPSRLDEIRQLDENDSPADLSVAVGELLDEVTAARHELELAKGEISRMTMRPADEVLDAARDYTKRLDVAVAERNRLSALLPKCVECGKPAACLGNYDQSCGGEAGTSAEDDYACSDCCSHGNEDGHCWPLEDIPGVMQTLDINLTETVAENKKLEARVAELETTVAELRENIESKTDAIRRNNDVIDKLEARILNGPTEPGDLASRIRTELKAQIAALVAELAAFKEAVAVETIFAAPKR